MESEYWIVDTAFCLEVDKQKLHPKYFYYWCKQFDFTRYNKQGVLPSLTKNDLLKIEMPIPPMELQVRFVNIIEQADKSEYELRSKIDAIDNDIKSFINENMKRIEYRYTLGKNTFIIMDGSICKVNPIFV